MHREIQRLMHFFLFLNQEPTKALSISVKYIVVFVIVHFPPWADYLIDFSLVCGTMTSFGLFLCDVQLLLPPSKR